MSPLVIMIAAGAWGLAILAAGIVMLRRQGAAGNKALRRRLARAAAPLAGPAPAEDAGDQESIFRPTERRSRLAWLWDRIGSRYPLLDPRRAVPAALGAGAAAAGAAWFALWFLKAPEGWWTIPALVLAGAGGAWYMLGALQARQEAAFIKQFPEVVDQIVRLAGAGVPALEALSVVVEDAPQPIEPVLRGVCDGLLAGLDVDSVLQTACDRVRLAEFTMFAAVLRLQRRAGGGISTAFANLSETLRERGKTALKAHASTAQTRLTLLVLSVMPGLVLVAQKFIAPDSVEILFNTETGTSLLRWGIALIVTGLLVARGIAARATG